MPVFEEAQGTLEDFKKGVSQSGQQKTWYAQGVDLVVDPIAH